MSLFQCCRGGLRPEVGALCLRRRCRARPVVGGARAGGGVRCPRRARPRQERDEAGEGSERSNFTGVGERGQAATRGEPLARKGVTAAALTVCRRPGYARAGAGLSAPGRRVSACGSPPSLGLRPRPDPLEEDRGPFHATRPGRARAAAPGRHRYASPTRNVSGGSAVRVELRGSCASFPDALRQAEESVRARGPFHTPRRSSRLSRSGVYSKAARLPAAGLTLLAGLVRGFAHRPSEQWRAGKVPRVSLPAESGQHENFPCPVREGDGGAVRRPGQGWRGGNALSCF